MVWSGFNNVALFHYGVMISLLISTSTFIFLHSRGCGLHNLLERQLTIVLTTAARTSNN